MLFLLVLLVVPFMLVGFTACNAVAVAVAVLQKPGLILVLVLVECLHNNGIDEDVDENDDVNDKEMDITRNVNDNLRIVILDSSCLLNIVEYS
jgi:hypothetical protein